MPAMQSTNHIRQSFLDHFDRVDHTVLASAPLVPHDDPSLMFVNAGMVPFKNVFTGLESAPAPRAASSQKCVRAGGKHNDLDNVGYTARHHTFFEMLGNFSFGDYFKPEAIEHAWSLLTGEWGLDPDRLLATVYHTDDDAFDLWRSITGLPEKRILRIASDDNFWSMGETGPCGPCSEIFYDHGDHIAGGPPGSADEDGDRFVEIWNLVFMQYDRQADSELRDLPRPSIDTGMGLERIAAVMQGQHDNYAIDLFQALIGASEDLTGVRADGPMRASHKVVADHLRSSAFLLADGVLPANEGRGYVLRRIMRRAMRHAHLIGADEPLMHRLVPALVSEMGPAYPELVRAQPLIADVLHREESRFRRTLEKGLHLLDEATETMGEGAVLDGEIAFKLYDTYGFPLDLTQDALRARGIAVDQAGFDAAMRRQREAARAAWKGSGEAASDDIWFDIAEREGATEFIGHDAESGEGRVVSLIKDGIEVDRAEAGDEVLVLTNQTPFYGESGGQAGDAGAITSPGGLRVSVTDTGKPLGRLHAHQAKVEHGAIERGDTVHLEVDAERRDRVRANHSATHLLHAALRHKLGEHVTQKGSLVAEDRLRFDFSHPAPLTRAEIAAVEDEVNAEILANEPVGTRLMSPDEAIEAGALALFGEKYGEEVRVLSMGRVDAERTYSVELCGGTHVRATGDIGLFRVVAESAVSSGVRRIEALTGEAARRWLVAREEALKDAASALRTAPDDVPSRVAVLVSERRELERELAEARKALALGGNGPSAPKDEEVAGIAFSGKVLDGLNPKELRPMLDDEKARLGSGIAAAVAVNDGKAAFAVAVTEDLTKRFDAVALVRAGVEALGGKGGGGRPDMAQGGGPDGDRANQALDAVRAAIADG